MILLEKDFNADFGALATKMSFDVVRLETKLDDGLPDYHLTYLMNGRPSWVELKIGQEKGHTLNLKSLQVIQAKFLQKRLKTGHCNAVIIAKTMLGYYMVIPQDLPTWPTYARAPSIEHKSVIFSESLEEHLHRLRRVIPFS